MPVRSVYLPSKQLELAHFLRYVDLLYSTGFAIILWHVCLD
ncbi:hypothetical protein PCS_00655 [Desulfocurvibacter africanus PCS]|uniref:Uncharacterized protein n=1 Tax=Desulfocurvibacter africanus PCS TaxID=1262666 RepID=M5Q3T6_DESAF|nr:hypothetical protein PCS_00655 [Desulfocurvibacter africanus PCS]